jgi:hypothetical protein
MQTTPGSALHLNVHTTLWLMLLLAAVVLLPLLLLIAAMKHT